MLKGRAFAGTSARARADGALTATVIEKRQDRHVTTTTATIDLPTTTRTPGWAGAFAGLIGAAVALGVSELIAGLLSPRGRR